MAELQNKIESSTIPAQRFADLVLDIGTFLLASGAHCGRLNSNLGRLASTWEFELNMSPTFKGLLVTVKDLNNPSNFVTSYKASPLHNVHLAVLTEISHLSWKVQEEKLSIIEVEKELKKIKEKSNYKDIVVATAVGFSCAGLCLFSLGDEANAFITFIAAFIGYLVRVGFSKKNFNAMICISIAAFVTTLITGFGRLYGIGSHPEAAMATAVLYLIPGVPLINCVIDLIEGYLSAAINRALFGGFILLCIAAGMTLCITLMGISNF
ncbi:MAG: threonine/serine exporter family protein [Dysgonomonas sp.]|nr:threonine/serine exporter family protein [Dysgonomonas sp.]